MLPISLTLSRTPSNTKSLAQSIISSLISSPLVLLFPCLDVPEDYVRGRKFTDAFFLIPYSVYYIGEWKAGKPQGLGEVVFKSGSILYGTFNEGKAEGSDLIFIMENGSYYRGSMKDN